MFLPARPPFMIDKDVAQVYEITTRKLNQAVNRNPERFPDDFRFQLTKKEESHLNLKFQSGTSSWGGRRKPILAYTREGCHMVLKAYFKVAICDLKKLKKILTKQS